jgi:hypothetical protein
VGVAHIFLFTGDARIVFDNFLRLSRRLLMKDVNGDKHFAHVFRSKALQHPARSPFLTASVEKGGNNKQ